MKQPRFRLLLTGDILAISIAFLITLLIGFGGSLQTEVFTSHIKPFSLLYSSWVLIFYIFELYDIEYHRHGVQLYTKIAQAILVCLVVSIAFFYVFPFFGITPRTNLAINIVVFSVLFVAWRIIFSKELAKKITLKTLILDPNNRLSELRDLISSNTQLGLGIPELLQSTIHINKKYDLVIADATNVSGPAMQPLLNSPTSVISASDAYEGYFQKIPIDIIDTQWLLENTGTKNNLIYSAVHNVLDKILAILLLLFSLPVTLPTAIIIKLQDGGPIFYSQIRSGLYGKTFRLYKFRSMGIDAEKNGAEWSSGKSDTRVTKFGKIIRKLHIDEIPQMLNILKGDIALVGPRAERPEFVSILEKEVPHYKIRHMIKPGFTGWAQVKFFYARTVMDSHEKFQYDLYYIKNQNLLLDLAIIVRTVYIIFKH